MISEQIAPRSTKRSTMPKRTKHISIGLTVVLTPALGVERLVEADYLATAIILAVLTGFACLATAFMLRAFPDRRPDLTMPR